MLGVMPVSSSKLRTVAVSDRERKKKERKKKERKKVERKKERDREERKKNTKEGSMLRAT